MNIKNNNQISVLISTFNNENSIKAAVESIQHQTFENLEILIMDDGSHDNTFNICKDLSNEDSRIRIFQNEKNIGLTRSLNKLIKQSQGYYIARQDADDISLLSRLETQIKFLKDKNLDIVYSRANIKNSNKVIPNLSFYLPKKLVLRYSEK